jgi:hypothetical protein
MPFVPLLASICPTSPDYLRCLCSPPISLSTFLINLSVNKGKFMRNQLTQWSVFQFLCRDSKNCQHLDHDLNNYVCHCRSRCKDSSVYLKPAEEMFYAIKDVKYLLLASAHVFSRLGTPVSIWFAQATHEGYQPTGERRSPQRLHLPVEMPESICQGGDSPRQNIPIHTSPTPCPTMKTHTVHSRSGRPILSVCRRHSGVG